MSLIDQASETFGTFTYSGGQWVRIDAQGNRQELTQDQQNRLTEMYNDPQRRDQFSVRDFTAAEVPPRPQSGQEETTTRQGTTYSGPTTTYRTIPSGASEEDVNAALERCRNLPATQGQCHRDGNRIVMGPESRGRSEGGSTPVPERGEETQIRFFPPVEEEVSADVQTLAGTVFTRGDDGRWRYTDAQGRSQEASSDVARALDVQYRQRLEENLQLRQEACHAANSGQCFISGDRVIAPIAPREAGAHVGFYGAYRPGSPELESAIEECNGAHGNRCFADDRGNIQFRMTGSEQLHEYWVYNGATGQIERTTEAGCSAAGGVPSLTCCTDSQVDCEQAQRNHQIALEQARMQTMWEGKQAVRGWIKIFVAFGMSDEWDREIFQDLIQWAETTAGLFATGRWEESICRYTPDFDQPTSMVMYPGSNQFGIWIEGAKTVTSKVNESDPQRGGRMQKLYKITGSVMPRGLTFNSGKEGCADEVRFNIMLDDDVVDLGKPGSAQDLVDLNCDSEPYSLVSQDATYINDSKDYNRVCFRFETRDLKQAIREQLPGGKLCARIVESGTPQDLGCRQESRIMQGGWELTSSSIDCSAIEPATAESDLSRGGTDDQKENRPAPRPPSMEI